MTQTISSKDLRLKFPWVQEQLSQGVHFIVICRSKPVGILGPFDSARKFSIAPEEALDEDLINAQIQDASKALPPLSEEETAYYLNLPDISSSS